MGLSLCETSRAPNLGLPNFVEVTLRVCLCIETNRQRLLLHERVVLAVDGWIDAQTENMLVVLCKGARIDNFSPASTFARIDIDNGHNSCSADLCSDSGGLIDFEAENILVVCEP